MSEILSLKGGALDISPTVGKRMITGLVHPAAPRRVHCRCRDMSSWPQASPQAGKQAKVSSGSMRGELA